jgi:hypothetical protein
MQELADALAVDDPWALLGIVEALEPKRKKAAAKWLVDDWKDSVGRIVDPSGRFAPARIGRWARSLVALTAAAAQPRQALAIPAPNSVADLGVKWAPRWGVVAFAAAAQAALAQAAINRGPAWCAEFLALVADAKKPRPMPPDILLAIAHAHALDLAATPLIVEIWAQRFFELLLPHNDKPYARKVAALTLARDGAHWIVRGEDTTATTPIDALLAGRGEQATGAMLLRVLGHRDAVNLMQGTYLNANVSDQVVAVIAQMLARGVVDRDALALSAAGALARGDSPHAQRLQSRLLLAAEPTPGLVQANARLLASLMASGTGGVASAAQQVLRAADTMIPDDLFVETCQIVFARKEKGLREHQLDWARRRGEDGARAGAAALGLCEALASGEHALQRDAVRAIEASWPRLPPQARAPVLAQIEMSRGVLDEALFARLWASCADTPALPASSSPPAAPRVALQRPGMTLRPFVRADFARLPAEVVHALGAAPTARDGYQFERAIRAAMDALNAGAHEFAVRLGDRLRTDPPFWMRIVKERYEGRAPSRLAWQRIEELREAIARGAPQIFLSTPNFENGAIAPMNLAARLEQLAEQGGRALPIDFLVALLRTEYRGPESLSRLRAIGTREGAAAAAFIAAGGAGQLKTSLRLLEPLDARPRRQFGELAQWADHARAEVCVALSPVAQLPDIDGIPLDWALGFEPESAPVTSEFDMVADWITPMLPNNAEALAALHLWGFRRAGLEYGVEGGKNVARRLPLFLEAHGRAGPALHLAVLFCLSANDAPVRLVGSDGLVTLLQQRRYDSGLACELLAACIARGSVKTSRLAGPLAQVREAGEGEAIWPLVRAGVVASLARDPVPAGTANLLELAIRLAADHGRKEHVPELAAAAAGVRGKPTKLQGQILRLRDALSE